MNEKKVGRPSRKYETKSKFFNIRKDLADKLKTYTNQTEILEQSLEQYFNLESQSNQHLYQLKEKLERELTSVNSLLNERERKENQERLIIEKEQRKLEEIYQRFCRRIENEIGLAEKAQFKPSISRINESFGIHITEKQYFDILSSFKEGKFSLDDFRKLRNHHGEEH